MHLETPLQATSDVTWKMLRQLMATLSIINNLLQAVPEAMRHPPYPLNVHDIQATLFKVTVYNRNPQSENASSEEHNL